MLPRQPGDRRRAITREARQSLAAGARRESVEPRGARAGWPRSPTSRTRTPSSRPRSAKALADRAAYGDVYRVAGELAARNYRFDEAVALTQAGARARSRRTRARSPISAPTCCAPATSRARASALDASFKLDPYNVVTFNLLGDARHARHVRRRCATATSSLRHAEGRGAGAAGVRARARPRGAHDARGALRVHAAAGRSSSRSSRKHDDFAVRNVGLPGMIGALGACFGRVVTMDSPKARPPGDVPVGGDALARAGARHHAADVEPARAALADRGHLGLRREARATPSGRRQMDVDVRRAARTTATTLKLRDLNAAFTDPRTISLAYYEASLLVEHLVTTYGDAGLRQPAARVRPRARHRRRAARPRSTRTSTQLQAGFDQSLESHVRPAAPRARGSRRRRSSARMPLDGAAAVRRGRIRGSYPGADGARPRAAQGAASPTRRCRPSSGRPRSCRWPTGEDSPHAQMAEHRARPRATARGRSPSCRRCSPSTSTTSRPRAQLAALLQEAGVADPATARARSTSASPRSIRSTPRRTATLGRLALAQRNDAGRAAREFRAVLGARARSTRPSAHTDLAESYLKAGKRADAKKQTLAALEIAPTYERAQDLLLKLAGQP